jgi:hypothetical protein
MPRGRKPAQFPKELYSFRLGASPETAREKDMLDSWLAAELPNTLGERAVALERVIVGLIRSYAGIEAAPPASLTTVPALDVQTLKNEIMADVRSWLADFIQDDSRFALMQQAREVSEGDDFADDLMDNILEDFVGRQSGQDED